MNKNFLLKIEFSILSKSFNEGPHRTKDDEGKNCDA